MAAESLLRVPSSSFESPLMYDISEHRSSGADSPGSTLGSSVTACKKVLCSNSLLESTDYWLQNQRAPCRIGIVEDKLEKNYTSVCFVNLDACKDDCNEEHLKQRLISVSPNLPKLISSMNVQSPKENEIILLSGLTPGNLQPQCSWLADVCLVQCARGNRKNSTSRIIFEINKFLIGLELVQEQQLHIEASVLKPEDDTNCSVSSIEEDFLTASEHLDEENEADEYKNDQEKLDVTEPSAEFKKYQGTGLEILHCKQARLSFPLEANCIQGSPAPARTSCSSEEDLNVGTANRVVHTVTKAPKQPHWKANLAGKSKPSSNADDLEDSSGDDTDNSDASEDVPLTTMAKEGLISSDDATTVQKRPLDTLACRDEMKTHPPMQNEQATAGHFATSLAEAVLQDAFVRLSQSTFTEDAAASISVADSQTSAPCATEEEMASRPWNELPKIVIVQSPDGSESVPEWPGSSLPKPGPWSETEQPHEVADRVQDDISSGSTQSALEVALACAATVIGTISSPHAAEKLQREQEDPVTSESDTVHSEGLEPIPSQSLNNCASVDYSFPSALCGMTQVASAVAVCGLGEKKDDTYSVTSSGLLSAAEASAAVTLHCSIAIGSSMENLNGSIAQVLFQEASLVLTNPEAYQNTGEFMESINEKIVQAVRKPPAPRSDEVIVDELAQNLSNIILRHSVEEVRKEQLHTDSERNVGMNSQDLFIAAANNLLFNVLYFTCKKMSDIAQLKECSNNFAGENFSRKVMDSLTKESMNKVLRQSPNYSSNEPSLSTDSDKDLGSLTKTKDLKGDVVAGTQKTAMPHADLPPRASGHSSPTGRTSPKKRYLKRTTRDSSKSKSPSNNQTKKERRSFTGRENTTTGNECKHGIQEMPLSSSLVSIEGQEEKHTCDAAWHSESQLSVSLLGNQGLLPPQPLLQLKQPTDKYCIADFAEELAETVVSMATEIAAICLDNSNGKQPWFSAWKKGGEYLMPQALSCWTLKRKKETTPSSGSVVRKHRPPRLSEIKKKTDEHPELKERLMNRVVDESINLDDTPESSFATEVATKIMNLAELSVSDNVWQSPNHPRNRLHCDRWNRVNASSCESIPEEDLDSKGPTNTLGLMNTLGQPISRTSSISKQSSCESITDEFSRFMVNQMENEGREFDLLLDYYAGMNASNILTSALQQASKKNGHLNVRPSCPSKQSSTESITEEFYRYMLKEIEKENKENVFSARSSKDWGSSLLSPSQRSPFCFRQSSMPDSRSPASRLTVNVPIKANSLDGFSRSGHQDSLSVQPVSTMSTSGLCKSDSYLYQRCRSDQITDMLIHETWANSIKALMCKNKIIVDDTEVREPDQCAHDSPPHVQKYANRLAANIVESGKTLIAIHQDSTNRDNSGESSPVPKGVQSSKPIGDRTDLEAKRQHFATSGVFPTKHASSSACLREVPLIQIETDQREDLHKGPEPLIQVNISPGKTREPFSNEKPPQLDSGRHMVSFSNSSLCMKRHPEPEVLAEAKAVEEFPMPLSSSDESTGSSWCQLGNEEDNPEDTSSYLQLSERFMSNGNSSSTSSLGIMDLEIYQENMPSSRTVDELTEENTFQKKEPENREECTAGLSVETASRQKNVLVINFDLDPECPDVELRTTLQWIAASELGIPIIYFKKSQENRIEKFLDVVQLVHRKSWKVGDIFHAVVQFCKLHEESRALTPSLFDWLLELG